MTDEFEKKRETRLVMVEAPSAPPEEEIDLIDLLRLLIGSWKLIGGVTVLVTAAALAYALQATEIFKAEALLVPAAEEKSRMSSALGQFDGLAAMTGVSSPLNSYKEQVLATLKSRKFLGWFIKEKNLLPILFEKQWDETKKEWKIEPGEETPSINKACSYFTDQIMTVEEEVQTSLITLSILWKDPEVAAQWANDLVRRLNEELRSKAIEDSRKRVGYIEKELAKTMVKDMKEVLYSLLESEKQKAMLANVNEEFALKVIDPAVAPELRAEPRRRLIVVLGCVCGFLFSVFTVFLREFFRKLRTPKPTEASS